MDERDHNADGSFKVGFRGKPFSVCLHPDMPSALENAKAGRKWLIVTRLTSSHVSHFLGKYTLCP